MNTKFTKGPWAIDRGNAGPSVYDWTADHAKDAHTEYFRIVDPSRQHVVAMAVFASDAFGDSPENAANAALIASAPELYEALEQIAALYIDDRSSSMHKALCIANKALKKARCEA